MTSGEQHINGVTRALTFMLSPEEFERMHESMLEAGVAEPDDVVDQNIIVFPEGAEAAQQELRWRLIGMLVGRLTSEGQCNPVGVRCTVMAWDFEDGTPQLMLPVIVFAYRRDMALEGFDLSWKCVERINQDAKLEGMAAPAVYVDTSPVLNLDMYRPAPSTFDK